MLALRTRKLLCWLSILLLGIPLAHFLLRDISVLVDQAEYLASVLLILSLMAASWRLKKQLKRRMEQGLGRGVADSELVSIAQWMKIPEHARKAAREADRFDFNDS